MSRVFNQRKKIIYISVVLVLVWIVYLRLTLPKTYSAQHWRMAWIGFDIALFGTLITTLNSYLKKSLRFIPASYMSATFLFIDSWFDVVTAQRGERLISILMAILLQLPLAIVLFLNANKSWKEHTARD